VKNILKYLNRTKEMFLVYRGDEEVVIKGYVELVWTSIPMILNLSQDTFIF
jgi:hypothetical protein